MTQSGREELIIQLHFNAIVVSECSSCKTEGKFVFLGCADTIVRNWSLLAGHSSPN